MYADGHLASLEDSRVQRLLRQLGVESESDINRVYDASVSRVSQHAQTHSAATELAVRLAAKFESPDQQYAVVAILNDLLASDGQVPASETDYLSLIKRAFDL